MELLSQTTDFELIKHVMRKENKTQKSKKEKDHPEE
jgi:hypothetical protein